jgi:hypothetical protein
MLYYSLRFYYSRQHRLLMALISKALNIRVSQLQCEAKAGICNSLSFEFNQLLE